jgi:methylmalonyl-CoA/ethylmalonyl-CoA epimerase
MRSVSFDHIALGAPRIADAVPLLVGVLGGAPGSGGPSGSFRWASWLYADGGSIEVIEPRGTDGFMHRFLARDGAGIHHVTFKVSSLAETCARAEAHGYEIVGRDESDATWRVAYLHPKQAQGIVVQLAQASEEDSARLWEVPPGPPAPPPAVTVIGLRLRAPDAERVRTQWVSVLGAEEAPPDGGGTLVFTWPSSPMRIAVDLDPRAEAGPVAIEVATDRRLELPAGPVPPLGTIFRQVPALRRLEGGRT